MVSLAAEFPNDNALLHRGVRWVCLSTTGAPSPERAIADEPDSEPSIARVSTPLHEPAAAAAIELSAPESSIIEERDEEDLVVEELEELEPAAVSVEGTDYSVSLVSEPLVSEPPTPSVTATDLVLAQGADEDELPLSLVATETIPPPALSSELPDAPDDPFTVLVCTLVDIALGAGATEAAALLPDLLVHGRLAPDASLEIRDALARGGILDGEEVSATFAAQASAWRALLSGTSDDFEACGGAMLDEWSAELLARLLGEPARTTLLRRDLRDRGVAAFGLAVG